MSHAPSQPKKSTSSRVVAHRPAVRRPGTAPAQNAPSTAKPVTSSKVVARPAAKSTIAPPARDLAPRSYVAMSDGEMEGEIELRTSFYDTVNKVKALTVVAKNPAAPSKHSLAETRGYAREDLLAVAEIGYHYLMNGGTKLALTLFEGLAAVAPREAYFALAVGLALDHEGDRHGALEWYTKAAQLDPTDARPDVNRAELYLELKDRGTAKKLLARALEKARRRGEETLEKKAAAMLSHLNRAA